MKISRKEETEWAAEGHGLLPWMIALAFGRDVAPLAHELRRYGLCQWGSTKPGYIPPDF